MIACILTKSHEDKTSGTKRSNTVVHKYRITVYLRVACQGGCHCPRNDFFVFPQVCKGCKRETPVGHLSSVNVLAIFCCRYATNRAPEMCACFYVSEPGRR